ncbi:MAG: hypothetical protein IJ675_09380, partial [Pseudobutyrivibrio sp.]|nr:hypothetical protein [Pseudobutyrivibrio sp.]
LALLAEQNIIKKHWGSGNMVAAKPNNNKSATVMVLLLNDKSEENKDILNNISSVLKKNNLDIEFHETCNSYQKERDFLRLLLQDIYAGLIICMVNSNLPSTNSDILQLLLKRQTPIVFINAAPRDLYNATVVELDNYNKGYLMARQLINNGREDIGATFINNDAASVKTFSGFIDAIRDANLPIDDKRIIWRNYNHTSGYAAQPSSGTKLIPSKSLGKECAKALLAIKKNGSCKSITIPFKSN